MPIARGLLKKLFACGAKSFTKDVKEGHVRVCVGTEEPRMFELDARFLNHPLLEDLLDLSVEQVGYSYDGALRIACDVDLFSHLLHLLRSNYASVHYMELQLLMDRFYSSREQRCHIPGQQVISSF
ncbi:uncharacterized protein A4U43_C05F16250 [Asparagus officinalis]|uniref:Uncharacterized protein n=1 Tax=Asparagus officinalis TaxID=4686 RepID=A0A5P1EVW3_ASPOF|nr:uncharacterized protein A4U43_C05F16250 [Asparagus officinalis]